MSQISDGLKVRYLNSFLEINRPLSSPRGNYKDAAPSMPDCLSCFGKLL